MCVCLMLAIDACVWSANLAFPSAVQHSYSFCSANLLNDSSEQQSMMANGLTFVAIHLALFLAIQAVTCLSDSERSHWCATPDPSAEDMQRVEHASRQFMEKFMPAPRTASPQSKPTPQPSLQPIPLPTPTSAPSTLPGSGEEGDGTTISVYFHVIYSSTGQGDPSDDAIASQIDILNSNFDGTGFTFSLAGTPVPHAVNNF